MFFRQKNLLRNHQCLYFEDIETFNSTSKIQAVYQAVVEFIKWYNNQTK
jgi:hypothetical protein